MHQGPLNRRRFLAISATALATTSLLGQVAGGEPASVQPTVEDGLAWYDVTQWGVEGRGWTETRRYFDRLPAKAEGVVRAPVWSLSRHSAGMCVRFATDAAEIHARYTLLSSSLGMPHMPPTGVSGLDLYAQDDEGTWRWVAVSRPRAQTVKAKLVSEIRPGRRAYMAYLPLYNGVESMAIGVPPDAAFEPLPPRTAKPIVYYGTSIAHGACASRPGMAFPAILGRRLDRPVVNLGFSGNGRMDWEVVELMAELDAAVYCIDCLPNMEGPQVAERAEPLVRTLREGQPAAPIVLIEDRTYANTWLLPDRRQRHTASRAALRAAYEKLRSEGVEGLYYIEGEHLLGDDDEATTDSSHPSDLGMMRMADALEPVLRAIIAGQWCCEISQ
jgi:lysophospholipase L1-like esterase